ncbi:helix-turn-helix domain-containing protein [Mucilaginibacter myungsuensis]|uniref:Helix-turn-helix transcriptional regulator n=1 Tax=Mucilaginibacter myungsuensis TaxID=649104 RepID=A0A929KWC4_9SPHI|nr:AraC family transcriptional regulator [Mucilaginibacter myungsuensis]MBE9661648.1 helix-turn-helix transcriptional regulator [Mucilaginibacter myungsuensis]MDN3597792.1 AraC family transcriptional regulator [Mucilaginibacter myungsuensis]
MSAQNQHSFSLLNVDQVRLTRKWNYQNVISPYCRIYYIDEGRGELSDHSTSLVLEPGYLYIIPSFTLCSLKCDERLGQYFVQFFEESADGVSLFVNQRNIAKVKATSLDQALFDRLLEVNPNRGINRSDDPRIYEKEIFYKEYQQYNDQQTRARGLETQGIITQLISRFLITPTKDHIKPEAIPGKIADALNYILLNLHQELSVELLASRAGQNVDYFSRIFQQHTGMRPSTFINQKRIERAKYLMDNGSLTLPDISRKTGFESVAYFSRVFKQITGLSPRYHRKQS